MSATSPRRPGCSLAAALASAAIAVSNAGAAAELQADRFSLELGTFIVSTDTTLRVDGSGGQQGTEFDLERKLGFDDATRFRADFAWRFAQRHALRAMIFENNRGSTRRIDETLVVGDVTYPVNVDIRSRFETRIIDLAYEYVFLRRGGHEVAASAGLHKLRFQLGLEAETPGSTGGQASLRNTVSTGAPLPLLGLRGTWQLAQDWRLNAQAQYFALSVDDYDGNIQDYRVDATWMFSRHVGVGLGYNRFRIKVNLDKPHFNGRMSWEYAGPVVFVRGAW